jgi:hypothetical protein
MQLSSEIIALGLVLFASSRARSSSSSSSSPLPGADSPDVTLGPGGERPMQRTGETDPHAWARRRLSLLVPTLQALTPPVPADKLLDVAVSILAQWAHETGNGRAEFNFNMGGWTARVGDAFHVARDVLTPGKPQFRWTAYDDLGTAIEDQVKRIIRGFPTAWRLLTEAPETSQWIARLGRDGYFSGDPDAYARAWASHRTELLSRLPR